MNFEQLLLSAVQSMNTQTGQILLNNRSGLSEIRLEHYNHQFDSIRILYLEENKIKKLIQNVFFCMKNLTRLYLGNNEIKESDLNTFSGLENLLLLDLNNNKIEEIHRLSLQGLNNLQSLFIYSNPLKIIHDKAFECVKNLKVLFLHNIEANLNISLFKELKLDEVTLYDRYVIFKPDFSKIEVLNRLNAQTLTEYTIEHREFQTESSFVNYSLRKFHVHKNYKQISENFKWDDINGSFSLILGENSVGKTTLLNLIYESLNHQKNVIVNFYDSFGNKHYFNNTSINSLNELDYILNYFIRSKYLESARCSYELIKLVKNKIRYLLNVFCLNQYLDYLILINEKDNLLEEFKELNKDRIEERCDYICNFLGALEEEKIKDSLIFSKCLPYFNELKRFEYYLNKGDDYIFSPGEIITWLKNIWKFNLKILEKEKEDVPLRNFRRIVILDEPDSHMHPNLIKEFYDLVTSENVKKLKFQFIITSHNPGTVALIEKEHIYEMKQGQNNLTKIKNKSTLQNRLTDNLYFIKEPFKIVFVEGELGEDKVFYETIYEIVQKKSNTSSNRPIKFQEMGSKMFNKLFLKNINQSDHNLNPFIYGINDGDDNVLKKFNGSPTKYDYYTDNFLLLDRYCMENYTFDILNVLFGLNRLIQLYNTTKLDDNKFPQEVIFILDFMRQIRQFKSLDDYLMEQENSIEAINLFLKQVNDFYKRKINTEDKKFKSLDQIVEVEYKCGIQCFKFNYYPLMLCYSGKEFKSILNECFLSIFFNSFKHLEIPKRDDYNATNVLLYIFFDLVERLFYIRSHDQDNLDKIDGYLKRLFDFSSYEEYLFTINEYIINNKNDQEKLKDSFNKIIEKIESFTIKQINSGKFTLILEKNADNTVQISDELLNYCKILNVLDKYKKNLKKNRKEKENDLIKKFEINFEKETILQEDLLVLKSAGLEQIESCSLDKNSMKQILGWLRSLGEIIKKEFFVEHDTKLELQFRKILYGCHFEIYKKILINDLSLQLSIKLLIKTYQNTGILIDQKLQSFFEKQLLD